MGRPKLSLQEWCNEDQKLKLDFIEKESQRSGGLIQWTGNCYTSTKPPSIYAQLNNQKKILLDSECFEKLKSRYRTVKKKQKDHHLTKKQYMLDSQTIRQIKKIQEQNRWAREEVVIEHVINVHLNTNMAQKLKEQIKLKILQDEIEKNYINIKYLNIENMDLKQQIDKLLYSLAEAYLVSDHYKDLLENNSVDIIAPNLDETIILAKKEEVREDRKLNF